MSSTIILLSLKNGFLALSKFRTILSSNTQSGKWIPGILLYFTHALYLPMDINLASSIREFYSVSYIDFISYYDIFNIKCH